MRAIERPGLLPSPAWHVGVLADRAILLVQAPIALVDIIERDRSCTVAIDARCLRACAQHDGCAAGARVRGEPHSCLPSRLRSTPGWPQTVGQSSTFSFPGRSRPEPGNEH